MSGIGILVGHRPSWSFGLRSMIYRYRDIQQTYFDYLGNLYLHTLFCKGRWEFLTPWLSFWCSSSPSCKIWWPSTHRYRRYYMLTFTHANLVNGCSDLQFVNICGVCTHILNTVKIDMIVLYMLKSKIRKFTT